MRHDPFVLHGPPQIAPVEGELPPPLRLVEDDDDLLYAPPKPRWVRIGAALLAIFFGVASTLSTFATLGRYSPLHDAGDWALFHRLTSAPGR